MTFLPIKLIRYLPEIDDVNKILVFNPSEAILFGYLLNLHLSLEENKSQRFHSPPFLLFGSTCLVGFIRFWFLVFVFFYETSALSETHLTFQSAFFCQVHYTMYINDSITRVIQYFKATIACHPIFYGGDKNTVITINQVFSFQFSVPLLTFLTSSVERFYSQDVIFFIQFILYYGVVIVLYPVPKA